MCARDFCEENLIWSLADASGYPFRQLVNGMKEVDIGTSKTRNLTRNRRLRVIIAASDEQKGLTRDSAEFGLSGRLRDENPEARRRISVRNPMIQITDRQGSVDSVVFFAQQYCRVSHIFHNRIINGQ